MATATPTATETPTAHLVPIAIPLSLPIETPSADPVPIPIPTMPTPLRTFPSQPHPLDLIKLYLRPRVVSGITRDFIHEMDPYGATPHLLSSIHGPAMAGDGPAWYFFTTLRAKRNGGRTDRSVIAGSGWSWHQDRRPKPVLSNGVNVGYQLTLSYSRLKEGSSSSRVRSGWIMTEYGLSTDTTPTEQQPVLVLCKIYSLQDKVKSTPTPGASTSTFAPSPTPPPPGDSTFAPSIRAPTPPPRVSTSPPEFCHPPDRDLLIRLLVPLVSCNVLVHHHTNIYQFAPPQLVEDFQPTASSDGQEIWYFIARAPAADSDVRVVAGGLGCWEAVHATTDVLDGTKHKVGERKLFRFRASDGVEDGWHMVELTTCNKSATVLCKVYRTFAGLKRTHVDSPTIGCLGLKKAAMAVTAGHTAVM